MVFIYHNYNSNNWNGTSKEVNYGSLKKFVQVYRNNLSQLGQSIQATSNKYNLTSWFISILKYGLGKCNIKSI